MLLFSKKTKMFPHVPGKNFIANLKFGFYKNHPASGGKVKSYLLITL